MTKVLDRALAQVTSLPEPDQEEIGRKLLSHVEKLGQLRSRLDEGLGSLDSGQGSALDIDDFLADARRRHGGP
ncbi:MAG TPA: hypothetical protein VHX61_11710 [Rhizomicrobium sp.]|jgi:hypothetical protein|nr:hypothetical protein [Rhizomicrobium sp.]